LAFKQSKAVVKDWEAEFSTLHDGRRPNREEVSRAPEKVLVAYKNCKKIKAYFQRESTARGEDPRSSVEAEESQEPVVAENETVTPAGGPLQTELSFSGLFPKDNDTDKESGGGGACTDISNLGSKVWGAHLNKKLESANSTSSSALKFVSRLSLVSSSGQTKFTPASMKNRKRKPQSNKSQTFFGSLGDDSTFLTELSQSSFLDDTQGSILLADDGGLTGDDVKFRDDVFEADGVPQPTDKGGSNGGVADDLFPSVQCRLSSASQSKPQLDSGLSSLRERNINSAWLQRCGSLEMPTDHHPPPPRLNVPLLDALRTHAENGETAVPVGQRVASTLTDATGVPIEEQTGSRRVSQPSSVTSETTVSVVQSKESRKMPQTLAGTEETAKPVEQQITSHAAREEECEEMIEGTPEKKKQASPRSVPTSFTGLLAATTQDTKPEESKEPVASSSRRKPVNKRKRTSSSEDEYKFEETEEVKPKRGIKTTASRAAGGARKRRKAAVTADDEPVAETAVEGGVEAADGGDTSAPASQGPLDLNLFALGFEEGEGVAGASTKKFMTQEERLAMRVSSGKANLNYRKIDLKKKSYSKGKGAGKFMKKFEYKNKLAMKEGRKLHESKCYRCGQLGHFSRQCTGGRGDSLIPEEFAGEFGADEFPSLEEAQAMAGCMGNPTSSSNTKQDDEDDAALVEAAKQAELQAASATADPINMTTEPFIQSADVFDKKLIYDALKKFGYDGFRPGQEEGILRILRGESSLVLLATGSGKSLIYQLPAYLYAEKFNALTIVVSPLVSLMEDQVTGLPPFLRAAALHYNLSQKLKDRVVEQVKEGRLHFLLVSPEAVAGGGGIFGSLIQHLPPIAFVCIDEAHCVSQWSHNFRPSYLRLCKVVREKLGVGTILGLTATAPERTIASVAEQLGVPGEGVIRGPLLPTNLSLSVSKDKDRTAALLEMLGDDGSLGDCSSVIIYCTRREVCEQVATYLRIKFQERDIQANKGKSRTSATAEPYHAGMSPSRRKTVQNHFMSGKLRVVVATVAFGMGIDKSDIRAIVHYNMPKTFESYIQEIGRAGRDGLPARCHLFLGTEGSDLSELKRHIHSNSIDKFTLRKLLHLVFQAEDEVKERTVHEYKEIALSTVETVENLDLAEENISTLLCYLEAASLPNAPEAAWIKLANPVYAKCRLQCYGGPLQLRATAAKCPPLAAAIALQRKANGGEWDATASSVEFPVVEVSHRIGCPSAIVKKELKNLEWKSTPSGWRKSGIMVEFSQLSFHFHALTGVSEEEVDVLQDQLYARLVKQEHLELSNLYRLHRAFTVVSVKTYDAEPTTLLERSDKLKQFIANYFSEPEVILPEVAAPPEQFEDEESVRARVRSFVWEHDDINWNGRAVARIFHGIQSPRFQAKEWGRSRTYWRSHLHVEFNLLVKLAAEEILRMRTGQ